MPVFPVLHPRAAVLASSVWLASLTIGVAAEKALPAAPTTADDVFAAPPPVDLNGFGSDEPVARVDQPTRGVITFGPKDFVHTTMQHWEQYDWAAFHPKRGGRYAIRLTYTLSKPTLPVQLKIGEQRVKKNVTGSREPKQILLGEVTIEKADILPFAMYSPAAGAGPVLDIREIAFIPTRETEGTIEPAEDGTLTLPAKAATTWSELMRYEPEEKKNCLGFWTEVQDFAEWEFVLKTAGRYRVLVTQGCGKGQGGSKVAARLGDQVCEFTVEDTGGFQNWKEIEVGMLEAKAPGLQRLVLQPLEKKGKAILDVSKVTLVPVAEKK